MEDLLFAHEVDAILRFTRGKSKRLARREKLPHIKLPDGDIRFRRSDIEHLISHDPSAEQGGQHAIAR